LFSNFTSSLLNLFWSHAKQNYLYDLLVIYQELEDHFLQFKNKNLIDHISSSWLFVSQQQQQVNQNKLQNTIILILRT